MLPFLLSAVAAFELNFSEIVPVVNEKCPDLDKSRLCEDDCTVKLRDCSVDCGGGASCQAGCNRKMIECIDCK